MYTNISFGIFYSEHLWFDDMSTSFYLFENFAYFVAASGVGVSYGIGSSMAAAGNMASAGDGNKKPDLMKSASQYRKVQ